jgi:PAS domain S-box-containing protein
VDRPTPPGDGRRSSGLRDLAKILAGVAVVFAVGATLDVFDRMEQGLRRSPHLDELIGIAALTIAGIAVFALRRWRQAEEEQVLRHEAESRFREIVERVPAVAYVWDGADAPGTAAAAYISPQIEDLLGYTPAEWLADPAAWADRVHPEDLPRVLRGWDAAVSAERPFSEEYRIRRADGRWAWLRDDAAPVRRGDRGAPIYQGVLIDVSEQVASRRRVHEAEERYRSLVEQLPVVVYTNGLDEHSTAFYLSPGYEALTGYPVAQRLADPELWVNMLHPDDRERVLAESDRTNATGEPFDVEYRIVAADGRVVWLQDRAVLVRSPDGPVWQGVLTDVTARRRAEEAVVRRDAVLEAAAAAAERFLAAADPLTAMGDVLERLGRAGDATRASLWRNDGDGAEATTTLMHSWHTDGWEWLDDDPSLTQGFGWADGFERWAERLAAGRPVHGRVAAFPDRERDVLEREPFPILAVCCQPIIVDGRWWGYLALDRCESDELWSEAELEALSVVANTLGAAIARRAATDRLHDAERRSRSVIETIPAVTYVDAVDDTMETLYVSPQVMSALGFSPQEWIEDADLWRRQVHPDDLDGVIRAIEEHHRTGAPYDVEYRFRHGDGRWLWLRDQAVVIRDEEGAPLFSQGVIFDVTAQKTAERQVRDAEERFRGIVEHVPAGIYLDRADASLRSIYASPQIETITGIPPHEWIDDPDSWREAIHPDDRDAVLAGYLDAVADGRPWSAEYRIRTRGGRTIWVHDETVFLHDDEGRPSLIQGVMFDITERKLAEEALRESERREREAAERLRALDDMKNTFLAAVSHELRSPLTSILGLALTLERAPDIDGSERGELLHRLAANATKLDRLLKDLLDVDRLQRGIVEPQYRMTDVAALARRIADQLEVLEDRVVAIEASPIVMPVDAAKTERIVENLLTNAARHTPADVRIWLRVAPHDGGVVIAVDDDGPGVAHELRAAIFEPFRQGPTASPHAPGTGIGLSLVARFAELHGGRAWVEDRVGGGASFRVYLPAPGRSTDVRPDDVAASAAQAVRSEGR